MLREEVSFIPSSLVTAFINNKEVRILKLSTDGFKFRISEKIKNTIDIKTVFYIFKSNEYKELKINSHTILSEESTEFYYVYEVKINDEEYVKLVKYILRDYSRYANLKIFGDENEFSKEMVNYPAEKDDDFSDYYEDEKKLWMKDFNYKDIDLSKFSLAVSLDNDMLYNKYLEMSISEFKNFYFKHNFLDNHKLMEKDIDRLYIGNEFCHNLFPGKTKLLKMLKKAVAEGINITLCFTYLREYLIEKTKEIIDEVYEFCIDNNIVIEVVINDYGMLELLKCKDKYLKISLGVLLNKRKKDPRYIYKKGYDEHKDLMSENGLNSKLFNDFLSDNNIGRYEYESCSYDIKIAEGKHSMHVPFYVTNTSQYCTLYAKCTTMDRGNQKLVVNCPKYCNDYVFLYPNHLKMIGKYNSLFSFDDTLLWDDNKLKKYIDNGIDRIVLNFI